MRLPKGDRNRSETPFWTHFGDPPPDFVEGGSEIGPFWGPNLTTQSGWCRGVITFITSGSHMLTPCVHIPLYAPLGMWGCNTECYHVIPSVNNVVEGGGNPEIGVHFGTPSGSIIGFEVLIWGGYPKKGPFWDPFWTHFGDPFWGPMQMDHTC